MKHYIEIADLLLNAGVDVNFVDENGCTILMKHIGKGLNEEQLNLVKVLLEKFKADPKKVDARNCNTVCLFYLNNSGLIVILLAIRNIFR